MEAPWRIELLGGLRAQRGEQVVTRFRTRKTGLLLGYLAYFRQRAHRREELIELLWPEHDPEGGRQSLRKALSSLRLQLEPDGEIPIVADRARVQLSAAVATDVEEFRAALRAAARAADGAEQARLLERAVEQYQGELLPGDHDDWILGERQWLSESFFQALRQLLTHLERDGDFARALEYAQRGVSADPLREEAHRDLIRLYAATGQTTAALRQYRALERRLKEDLGAVPEAATVALVQEVERLSALRAQSAVPMIPSAPRTDSPPAPPAPEPPPAIQAAPPTAVGPAAAEGSGENRFVTVLFADMSGSLQRTAELAPDEGAALVNRLLTVMVDVLLKYGGRVDRFLGDGLLGVFGVPHAHEDDAERAVRAALEIRQSAQRLGLEVTVGVNTGEVYVGEVGSARHQEVTVVGPVVSLASRLQGQAEPGQVLVGEATYRQTRRAFEFSSRLLPIRGLAQPVAVYTVERALPRAEKARGIEGLRAELIGREEELAKLKQALGEVLPPDTRPAAGSHGEGGQIVCLIGEAGVGKSRLVSELKTVFGVRSSVFGMAAPNTQDRTPNTEHRALWLEGRCLEMSAATSYSLFVDLFRDFFAWQPQEDERARAERLAACLRQWVIEEEISLEQCEEMGPLLGNLLSLRFGTDWDQRLRNASPEQIRHQTFLAVRDFFLALSRRRPVVLVCEDLHWADSLSLDLLSLLMESLATAPLLLLGVYRPEPEHKCWHLPAIAGRKCPERFTQLSLRELTPPQSQRLIESLLTVENLPVAIKEQILERARGNPFFLEEVVRSLIDAGKLYREGLVWRAREGAQITAVPESVQSVIVSRLDRLRPDLKQVLQRAAVIGRLFRRRWLAALTGEGAALERALGELEDQAFVYQERAVPEEEYSFQHVLTQETVYSSLVKRQREPLHQQVAEVIERLHPKGLDEYCEQLAYHYERSAAAEKAVEYLLRAGEKARRAYANEAAIGYFRRALERLERVAPGEAQQEWRLQALTSLGRIYNGVGKPAEAQEQFRRAIALGREMGLPARRLVRLYYGLGEALSWQSRFEEMIYIGKEGLALLGDDTKSVEAALMNTRIAVGSNNIGEHGKGWEYNLRNARFLQQLPYSEELLYAYVHIVHTYGDQKNLEAAFTWLMALERHAEQQHDLRALGMVHGYTARHLLAAKGDLIGAVSRMQRALDLAIKTGDTRHQGWCFGNMAWMLLSLGDLQKAEECAGGELEVTTRMNNRRHEAGAHHCLGTIWLCRGSWERAVEAFERARQLEREISGSAGATGALALGHAYMAAGRRQDALVHFHEALTLAKSDSFSLAAALGGLEELYDDPEAFHALCGRFREQPIGAAATGGVSRFTHWYLEPVGPSTAPPALAPTFHDPFEASLSPAWIWHDPFGDCTYAMRSGLEIRAVNGRALWHTNLSAPRLLQHTAGDFSIQTVTRRVSEETPAIGGLLLWKDGQNFLRLERGLGGAFEISFVGYVSNQPVLVGRGRLPSERVFLRLERLGSRVKALCTSDGENWFTVGQVEFPTQDPLEVGLHAIGDIDRTTYPGAYPEGTAIRFESFELWV